MSFLSGHYDGLLVPGTIAAFQTQGTKGFVLSLSARSGEPYVIDPRFPLFQNRLGSPKRSHELLAELLGVPSLVNGHRTPTPGDFTPDVIETIARNWIDFNTSFTEVNAKTFQKYAARLNEEVLPESRKDPTLILPPYVMVGDLNDGWWGVADALWEASVHQAATLGIESKLRRVVAASRAQLWGQLMDRLPDSEVIAWISDLEEFRRQSEGELLEYGQQVFIASRKPSKVFALYGGFFSVLLARYGLVGSSHGIGYGEHRDWIELPSSGAAPARYYVLELHRYLGVDIATTLWRQFPDLISCDCPDCHLGSPSALDYHALMRHSVYARESEIAKYVSMSTADVVSDLLRGSEDFQLAVSKLVAPVEIIRRASDIYEHMRMWARVIESLG